MALLVGSLLIVSFVQAEDWPTCDNRAYRDDEIEPGGLKLLGVKESPLGYYPQSKAAATREHFFQQLREVLSDDCPRILVEVGLQPAAGPLRNWSTAALWLHYFNHSGAILAVDPVQDYLQHWMEALKEPWSSRGSLQVQVVRAKLGARNSGEAEVFFDTKAGAISAAEQVAESCLADGTPTVDDPLHPCFHLSRKSGVAITAPTRTFDDIWKDNLRRRHIDFLHINAGIASMVDVLERGFAKILSSRSVTILALRLDDTWTKGGLQQVVKILDRHDYFSMLELLCENSSQFGTFSYKGPDSYVGPTTYLPLSSMDIDLILDWDSMPLPQHLLAFDLQQPDVFKTVQIGDVQCDADPDGSCQGDDQCQGESLQGPPERPQLAHVTKSASRSITLEWRPHPDGPMPDSYLLRVEPGALEEVLDHDTFDALTNIQTYTINGLRPNVEYTISLRAMGFGGESGKVTLTHRTALEEETQANSEFEILESTHCGMGAAEEVQPAGPAPGGASYFPGVSDVDACRVRCESNRQCIAFQVNAGNACWLYRRKPLSQHLAHRQSDVGWWCAVRRD